MKSAILPAVLLFGIVAAGLLAVRNYLGGAEPNVAAAAIAESEAPDPYAGPRQTVLRKEADGHFWTTARVNGVPIRMMVDTGASMVVLTEKDARRAGLDPDSLPRTARVSTAGGRIEAAPVRLESVAVEFIEAEGVTALVISEGLQHSLLGMSFLERLSGWQATPGALVLKQ